MISRRGFIGILAGLAAAPVVEPIAKTLFLPPAGGWLPTASGLVVPGNQFLTVGMITAEALRILEKNLIFSYGHNRDYGEWYGAKIGHTLNVRTPIQFSGAYGR